MNREVRNNISTVPVAALPADRRGILLFVVNDTRFFLSHRLPIAQAAARYGYTVHVATGDITREEHERLQQEGFVYHPVRLSRRGMNPLSEAGTINALRRLFRQVKPQIVHLVTIKPVLYGGIAARLARVPAVVQALSGLGYLFIEDGSLRKRLIRALVRRPLGYALTHSRGCVIFQNPDDQAFFIQKKLIAVETARLIKGSGVDPWQFAPGSTPEEPPVVMLASRMLWDKGVAEFVEAAQQLKAQGVEARFVLAGASDPGNPSAVSEDQLKQWHAEGVIEWWGHQSDMAHTFSNAHVVCLPSYREGLPKVLLEAAACSLPLVATEVPGCREVVEHGANGFLVPPRDANSLSHALAELIERPDLRQRFGKVGRRRVLREFTTGHVVQQTMAVYDELVAQIP